MASNVYVPYGGAKEAILNEEPEVVLVGGAGTGKSLAVLTKLLIYLEKYEGIRCLILRKTRASLTQTGLVTWETQVLVPGHPALKGADKATRASYKFPNGSELVVGGLDKKEKILSSEYDIIYVQECIELSEEEWSYLNTRLRHGKIEKNGSKFHQLIGDTNPSTPLHWLKKRIDRGETREIRVTHKDNPRLFDHKKDKWTEEGQRYLKSLETGPEAVVKRMRHGEWCATEGARFPQADPEIQGFSLSEFPNSQIPSYFKRFVAVDYGTRDPFCALWFAVSPEGDVYAYKELYQKGLTADQQAELILEHTRDEKIEQIYMDPSMWSEQTDFKGNKQPSPATIYQDVLSTDTRFGQVVPGNTRKRKQLALATIDALLNRNNNFPNLFIERGLTNYWNELLNLTYSKTEEGELDDRCPDHAVTASYYGLHTYFEKPEAPMNPLVIDYEKAYYLQQKEKHEASLQWANKRFRGYGRSKYRY